MPALPSQNNEGAHTATLFYFTPQNRPKIINGMQRAGKAYTLRYASNLIS